MNTKSPMRRRTGLDTNTCTTSPTCLRCGSGKKRSAMSTPLSSVTMLCNREKYKEEIMLTDRHDEPCTSRNTDDIEEILHRYDAYIVALAWKKLPRTVVPLALLPDEREDLAQRVRIKLWQTLQKRPISNLKAYIGCI